MANQLINLAGNTLSDEGRLYSMGNDERSIIQELANGSVKKYIKRVARRHNISWTWLVNDSSATFDLGLGRDALISLYMTGGTYDFSITETGGVYSASVMFDTYTENLLRRDIAAKRSWYDINVSLKEV